MDVSFMNDPKVDASKTNELKDAKIAVVIFLWVHSLSDIFYINVIIWASGHIKILFSAALNLPRNMCVIVPSEALYQSHLK